MKVLKTERFIKEMEKALDDLLWMHEDVYQYGAYAFRVCHDTMRGLLSLLKVMKRNGYITEYTPMGTHCVVVYDGLNVKYEIHTDDVMVIVPVDDSHFYDIRIANNKFQFREP